MNTIYRDAGLAIMRLDNGDLRIDRLNLIDGTLTSITIDNAIARRINTDDLSDLNYISNISDPSLRNL